jgi:copper(I)-binding protein
MAAVSLRRALALSGAVLACGGGAGEGAGNPPAGDPATPVRVEGAYAYANPGSTELALYLVLRNRGPRADTLVHVQTPDAAGVMVHRYVRDGDMLLMEHLERLVVEARDSVVLEPGGLHLMLTAGRNPRGPGSTLHLSFRFSSGAIVTLTAPVLEVGAEPPPRR